MRVSCRRREPCSVRVRNTALHGSLLGSASSSLPLRNWIFTRYARVAAMNALEDGADRFHSTGSTRAGHAPTGLFLYVSRSLGQHASHRFAKFFVPGVGFLPWLGCRMLLGSGTGASNTLSMNSLCDAVSLRICQLVMSCCDYCLSKSTKVPNVQQSSVRQL